jgi:Na+-driven multidrug efflux pump
MARLFSNDQAVIDVLRSYIFITCAGYGLLEVHRYAGFCVTGIHEPVQATILNIIRVLCLLIPLSIIGEKVLHLNGVFWGRLVTDILAGAIGILWSGRILTLKEKKLQKDLSDSFCKKDVVNAI